MVRALRKFVVLGGCLAILGGCNRPGGIPTEVALVLPEMESKPRPPARPAPTGTVTRLIATETPLGRAPEGVIEPSLVASPDATRYACWVKTDQGIHLVLDGKADPTTYDDGGLRLIFSPDSRRFAFAGKLETPQGSKTRVVIDGQEGPFFDTVISDMNDRSIFFSPDSLHVAYVGYNGDLAKQDGTSFPMVDGLRQTQQQGVATTFGVIWSPDSRRWIMVCGDERKQQRVIVNNQPDREYDEIANSVLSITDGDVIVQNIQMAELTGADLSFSRDGQHYLYGANRGDFSVIVRDGKEVVHKPGLARGGRGGFVSVRMSPDGKRLGYHVLNEFTGEKWIEVDGARSKIYPAGLDIGGGFSPDGNHWAFIVKPSINGRVILRDGVESAAYDAPPPGDSLPSDLLFSPDSSRLAARVYRGTRSLITIDGVDGPAFEKVFQGRFSPNSRRFAYQVIDGARLWVMVDSQPQKSYDDLGRDRPQFSPNSNNVTYAAKSGERWRIVVDGVESETAYDALLADPRFVDPGTVRAMGLRDGQVFRVEFALAADRAAMVEPPVVHAPVVDAPVVHAPVVDAPPEPMRAPEARLDAKPDRVVETGDPNIRIEVYSDRASFEARLGKVRRIDFDDLDTETTDPVSFAPDRYRDRGIVITGARGQYAGRAFGWPAEFPPASGTNTYAPGPRAAKNAGKNEGGHETEVTFTAAGGSGCVAGFGASFIDADYPNIGACALAGYRGDRSLLHEEKPIVGGNAQAAFRGIVAVDPAGRPVAVLSRLRLTNGSGWPEVEAAEGATLDDFLFSDPIATEDEKAVVETPRPQPPTPPMEPQAEVAGKIDSWQPGDDLLPPHRLVAPTMDGKRHGEAKGYDPADRLIFTQHFVHGIPQGKRTIYYPSGQIFSEVSFEQGRFQGPARGYFPDGKLGHEVAWQDGQMDGTEITYYRSGQKKSERTVRSGQGHGPYRGYLPSGAQWLDGEAADGKSIREQELIRLRQDQLDLFYGKLDPPNNLRHIWEAHDWWPLFNGRDLTGWVQPKDSPTATAWTVEEGVLVGRGQRGGDHLHTQRGDYGDFQLRLETRINPTGNSGVYVRVPDEAAFNRPVPTGLEVQILGDPAARWPTGAVFQRSTSSSRSTLRPSEWFAMEIDVRDGSLRVAVNGRVTADIKLSSQDAPQGHIALQRWGAPETLIEFRKIEVKRILSKAPTSRPSSPRTGSK